MPLCLNKTMTFQSGATATGVGTIQSVYGFSTMVVQIKGITTATVTFEATVDQVNWVAIRATNLNSGTAATTGTADGLYQVDCRGLISLRCNISAYTSGTITVVGNAFAETAD